ncbi:MAG: hypothetical protein H6R10_2453 [Rhodocyclaceae bacterium]|nr:hypothetical protein [Rhodocyclaceae bacterium]
MDLTGLSSVSTALSGARTGDSAAVLVQKKAMDLAAQNAQQLLEALPQPTNNPPHLGQNVDVKA